jgi:hypothetical protein
MVIVSRNGTVNQIPKTRSNPSKTTIFFDFLDVSGACAFTPDSSRCLNCSSNLIGHDDPNKPANGDGE